MKGTLRTGLALLAASTSACTAILGGFDFDGKPTGTGGGGGTSTTGTTGTTGTTSTTSTGGGGTGGSGGAPVCEAGKTMPCYTGPAGTEDTGLCKGGTATCKPDGSGFGECVGEVTPVVENCAAKEDQDCNGTASQCTGLLRWAKRFGNATPNAVAVDGTGSTIVTGTTISMTDLGGGQVTTVGAFVVKYDDKGNHQFGATFGNSVRPKALVTDASDDIILAGKLTGPADFGGGAVSGGTVFLAKFDNSGAHVFSKALQVGSTESSITTAAADSSGNVIIAGYFDGTADFGGGPLIGGTRSAFVAKYDSKGKHIGSLAFGSSHAQGLGVDPLGNIVIVGGFNGTVDFAGKSLTAQSASMFVVKLDPNLKPIYAKKVGPGIDAGMPGFMGALGKMGVGVDAAGRAVIAAGQTGTVDLDGTMLAGGSDEDVLVAKLDPMGVSLWSKQFAGSGNQYPSTVAVDGVGNVAVAGTATGTINFGLGPGGFDVVWTVNANNLPFVAKLDGSNGGLLWVLQSYGGGNSIADGVAAVSTPGDVALAGSVQGQLGFPSLTLPQVSTLDMYVGGFAR